MIVPLRLVHDNCNSCPELPPRFGASQHRGKVGRARSRGRSPPVASESTGGQTTWTASPATRSNRRLSRRSPSFFRHFHHAEHHRSPRRDGLLDRHAFPFGVDYDRTLRPAHGGEAAGLKRGRASRRVDPAAVAAAEILDAEGTRGAGEARIPGGVPLPASRTGRPEPAGSRLKARRRRVSSVGVASVIWPASTGEVTPDRAATVAAIPASRFRLRTWSS